MASGPLVLSQAPSAGRSSAESQRSMPSRPGSAVVTVSAPIMEKTSFNSLRKFEVMAKFLHQRLVEKKWLEEYHDNLWIGTNNLGTFVRKPDATFARTTHNTAVIKAVETINPVVAFTMSCDSVSVLLDTLSTEKEIQFMDGTTLAVVPSIADIKNDGTFARTGQYAALCKKDHFILVCSSSPPELLAQAASIESHLVSIIWGGPIVAPPAAVYNPMNFMTAPRSNSMPQMQQSDFTSFSFGEQPELDFTTPLPPQRRVSHAEPTHRRASTIHHIEAPPARVRQPSMAAHSRFPRRSSGDSDDEPPISPTYPSSAAMSRKMSSVDPFGRKMSVAAQASPHRPKVTFNEPQFGASPTRSRNFSTDHSPAQERRRSSVAPARSGSVSGGTPTRKSFSRVSFDSVPEDEVPEMHNFPPRKQSMAARNMSISSTYMGDHYRGSISEDILQRLEFVERAMQIEEEGEQDLEMQKDQKRPFVLTHACLVALAGGMVVTLDIWCAAKLVSEARLDGNYIRFALLATVPFFTIFSLFFAIVISGSFFQLFGPLGFLQQNTQYYSAKAPKLSEHSNEELPHITIQMPVYKEGLKGVIVPTITSVLKAVNYYQSHGGTATILVCDDGMQLISEELQEARKVFYELHNIAWIARPKQNTTPGPDYFLRKGKFKKASNMNYSLDFSLRVEEEYGKMLIKRAEELKCTIEEMSVEEEDEVLEQARQVVQERDGGKTWSAGDVRIGEFILIIDSDTRVPESCLLCGALEMMESPQVAIIQHSSGVMNQTGNTFENGITYFTDLIYTSITHAVGAGDVAPFVGHNAFLRWRAIQSIAFQEDGRTKFWSESHVSEDFEVSLRLQQENFIVRMAGYHGQEFKEGVSLTVYDELARWEKYAYGCNELLFHPLIYWPVRGPLTPLFKSFLKSNIKITSKFTIIAYIGTYYAIAVGFPLSIVNYVIAGWAFQLDQYYQTSWHIFVGLCVVYNILSPISFAMLRYRMGQCSYIAALGDCIKWTPLFMLFFGGLSYHLCKALLCHFFSINIEWTTTAKELEKTGFKVGLDKVFKDFWKMYLLIIPLVGCMVYLGAYAPRGWKITDFTVVVPLANQLACHALLPFALGLF